MTLFYIYSLRGWMQNLRQCTTMAGTTLRKPQKICKLQTGEASKNDTDILTFNYHHSTQLSLGHPFLSIGVLVTLDNRLWLPDTLSLRKGHFLGQFVRPWPGASKHWYFFMGHMWSQFVGKSSLYLVDIIYNITLYYICFLRSMHAPECHCRLHITMSIGTHGTQYT